MEAEVTELTGVAHGRARPGAPADPPQRLPRAALGHPGGHASTWPSRGSATARYFPSPARAAAAGRAGAARGRPGGLRAGRLARAGSRTSSRPSASTGISKSEVSRICAALDAEVEAFRAPAARRRGLSLPLARRDVRQGPRGGPGRVDGRARRDRRGDDRRAAGAGPRAGRRATTRARAWPALHPLRSSSAASPGVRLVISDDHRGPRQGRPRAAPGRRLAALPGPLHAQRPGPRAALGAEHGRVGHPLGLRAARRGLGPGPAAAGSSTASARASRRSPSCSPTPRPTCSPTSRSPRPTAARSAAPTR